MPLLRKEWTPPWPWPPKIESEPPPLCMLRSTVEAGETSCIREAGDVTIVLLPPPPVEPDPDPDPEDPPMSTTLLVPMGDG